MAKVRYIGKSYQDSGDRVNEDSFLLDRKEGIIIMAVADGVGGLERGEIASGYLVDSLTNWFGEKCSVLKSSTTDEIKNELHDQILKMHESLSNLAIEKDILLGSTLTCAIIKENKYIIAHVGDSRAYLYGIFSQNIKLLTKDQTVYQQESDKGFDVPEEEIDSKSRTLLQCMGYGKVVPTYYEGLLPEHFGMLLCSDGLSNKLSPLDFINHLKKEKSEEEILHELTMLARNRGENDNITSIYVTRKEYHA